MHPSRKRNFVTQQIHLVNEFVSCSPSRHIDKEERARVSICIARLSFKWYGCGVSLSLNRCARVCVRWCRPVARCKPIWEWWDWDKKKSHVQKEVNLKCKMKKRSKLVYCTLSTGYNIHFVCWLLCARLHYCTNCMLKRSVFGFCAWPPHTHTRENKTTQKSTTTKSHILSLVYEHMLKLLACTCQSAHFNVSKGRREKKKQVAKKRAYGT